MTVFDRAYEATPSWAIGRPQDAVVRLADAGLLQGSILDVGCGTGENTLEVARRGLSVVGIDIAPAAIERARHAVAEFGLQVEFVVLDVFELDDLGRRFDTILDVGLFHVLQPADRLRYAAILRRALQPGGRCHLVCWSDRNPFGIGPARVTQGAIRRTFVDGWEIESVEPEILATRLPMGTAHAWLARMRATQEEEIR